MAENLQKVKKNLTDFLSFWHLCTRFPRGGSWSSQPASSKERRPTRLVAQKSRTLTSQTSWQRCTLLTRLAFHSLSAVRNRSSGRITGLRVHENWRAKDAIWGLRKWWGGRKGGAGRKPLGSQNISWGAQGTQAEKVGSVAFWQVLRSLSSGYLSQVGMLKTYHCFLQRRGRKGGALKAKERSTTTSSRPSRWRALLWMRTTLRS